MQVNTARRIVAREGLVLIITAAVVMLAHVYLFSKIDFPAPKYKMRLTNGSSLCVAVYPEMHTAGKSPRERIAEMYNPSPALVKKRLKEFADSNGISYVNASRVNSCREDVLKRVADILTLNKAVQAGLLYLVIALLRFISWAIKTLRES
jgi:hypothetical protein